jgi:hypothetical protein
LSNSGDHANTRNIKKGGKDLCWEQFRLVYSHEKNSRFKKSKITPRHLNLDSYFKVCIFELQALR